MVTEAMILRDLYRIAPLSQDIVRVTYASFTHMMDRLTVQMTAMKGGRVGISLGINAVFEDSRVVRPTVRSTRLTLFIIFSLL